MFSTENWNEGWLKNHILTKHTPRQDQEHPTEKDLTSIKQLVITEEKVTDEVFTCKKCDNNEKDYKNLLALRRHENKVHKLATCLQCGAGVRDMYQHMQAVHLTEEDKQFSCEQCGKKFFTYHKLQIHMRVHSEGTFKCRYPSCNKETLYKDPSNMYAHERKSHGALYTSYVELLNKKLEV